jgi:hypothetical protein
MSQARQILDELLKGSSELFNPKSPLSFKSGSSILSKGTIEVPYKGSKLELKGTNIPKNLTDTFREQGEKQGNTALVLTEPDLNLLFQYLKVTNNTGKSSIQLYINYLVGNFGDKYKAKHFEFYTEDSSSGNAVLSDISAYRQRKLEDVFTKSEESPDYLFKKGNIKSFRGLNFSHSNALTHVASFIHYARTGEVIETPTSALSVVEKEISEFFHRGHILAQTTGRAMLSTKYVQSITDESGQEKNPILLLVELSRQLDIVSSGMSGINQELLSNIDKDFRGNGTVRMNIGFQLIRSSEGKGNLDTGEISTAIALVSTLRGLLEKLTLTQTISQKKARTVTASKSAAKNLDNFVKVLQHFLNKLDKDNKALYNKIGNILGGTTKGSFIYNLRSSDSLKDYLVSNHVGILKTGKTVADLKVKIPPTKIVGNTTKKPNLPKLEQDFKKLKNSFEKAAKVNKLTKLRDTPPIRNQQGRFTSLASLQTLLNLALAQQIQKNMGVGTSKNILNYRTGRLAESAQVTNLSQSREGMITAFYTYMKYPYQTFEPGYAQGSPRSRDPKLLISKSIREIMSTQVNNRLRAVLA